MPIMKIEDTVVINNDCDIYAATWQLSDDVDFENIIDETIFDTENILRWDCGSVIKNTEKEYYVRVKLYIKNGTDEIFETEWFLVEEKIDNRNYSMENYKEIPYTRNGNICGVIGIKEGMFGSNVSVGR